MIDLVIQSPNQNLLYRPNRQTFIAKQNTNTDGFYKKAIDEFNKKEFAYLFPANEARELNIYDNKSKNPLSLYDEQSYKILSKAVEAVKESCNQYELSYKKNKYFLYSEVVEDQNVNFWYDAGGTSKPNLFGIVSLDSNSTNISINEIDLILKPGDIVVSEAGNKIKYSGPFKSLLFYVAPISTIKNQYSQKWIPLV